MTSDYTVEINTKAKVLIYREGNKTFRFDMDTRARPMVVERFELRIVGDEQKLMKSSRLGCSEVA